MKFLLFVLILVTIWTQAAAGDWHDGTEPGATTTTIETTQVLNLDTSQAAAAMAGGLHQFDSSTDDLQLSFSGATIDGEAAGVTINNAAPVMQSPHPDAAAICKALVVTHEKDFH